VKANQNTLHRQIRSQVHGTRKIPFVATDHEVGHGPEITWRLRAKADPERIRSAWSGSSWIVEVVTEGTREDKPGTTLLIHLVHLSLPQQPADHDRSTAANGAGPLEYRGLALDPQYPAPGRCPSHPGLPQSPPQRPCLTAPAPPGLTSAPAGSARNAAASEPCELRSATFRQPCHHTRGNGAGAPANIRTAALNLLRFERFQKIPAGLQVVCRDITALLAMARRQPEAKPL
jgi:hypothetical protein